MAEITRQDLAEVESRMDKRFNGLEERFNDLGERFSGLEERFNGLGERFSGFEARFNGLEERFGGLEERLTRHTNERLEQLETNLLTAFHGWARTMEVRVRTLAGTTAAFDERLALIEERVRELERRNLPH